MLIHVALTDSRFDYVKDYLLDELIDSKMIVKFRRKNGWVVIGTDPVRKRKNSRIFNGVERRAAISALYPINIALE